MFIVILAKFDIYIEIDWLLYWRKEKKKKVHIGGGEICILAHHRLMFFYHLEILGGSFNLGLFLKTEK